MKKKKITILDGGMGRELERIGAPFGSPEWSARALMEGPEFVTQAHRNFIEAGADVITTNAYAVVPFHIGVAQFDMQGQALIALAGKLARDAADAAGRGVQVAGCVPPFFGSYRADFFNVEDAKLYWPLLWREQAAYVDLFLAETLTRIQEVLLACEISADYDKPLWLSVTPRDDMVDGVPVMRSGETIRALYDALCGATGIKMPDAILFNCAQPEVMEACVRELAALRAAHDDAFEIGVYANAFHKLNEGQEVNKKVNTLREDMGVVQYVDYAQRWVDAGATIVGGCCGIGPDYIEGLRKKIS